MSYDSHAVKRLVHLFSRVIRKCRGVNAGRFNYPTAMHRASGSAMFEQLEPRMMLNAVPVVASAIEDVTHNALNGPLTYDVSSNFWDDDIPEMIAGEGHANDVVYAFRSNLGTFYVQMFNGYASGTVANFTQYALNDLYDDTIIHRSVDSFVVQGGGFAWEGWAGVDNAEDSISEVPTYDPIVNEFGISNTRGTIAMAKLGGDPDSATSQWFFNLGDNSANLDEQNGGFTVFGEVIGDGMDIVDAIAALETYYPAYVDGASTYSLNGALTDVPMQDMDEVEQAAYGSYTLCNSAQLADDNFISFSSIDPVLRFEVTNVSNPGLFSSITIDETTGELIVESLEHVTGQTEITITATDLDGNTVSDTFALNIVEIIDTGEKYTFTEDDGDIVTITYKGRSDGTLQVVVADDMSKIESLIFTGADDTDSVTIKVKKNKNGGDGRVTIDDIDVDGSLKKFTGKTADVAGSVSVAGIIGSLQLGNVGDFTGDETVTITYNTDAADADELAPKGVKMKFEEIEDCTVDTNDVGISKLQAQEWGEDNATLDRIEAGWIGTMKITGRKENARRGITALDGDFVGSVIISEADPRNGIALKILTVVGEFMTSLKALNGHVNSITVGEWNATMNVYSLNKFKTKLNKRDATIDGSASGTWTITGRDANYIAIKSIKIVGAADSLNILANQGMINTITVGNWDDGSLRTMAVKTLKTKAVKNSDTVVGDMGIDMILSPLNYDGRTLKYTLGSVNVAGSLVDNEGDAAYWNIVGDTGTIKVKGDFDMQEMDIDGTLKSLQVKQIVSNSYVYTAGDIGSVKVGAAIDCDINCGVTKGDAGARPDYDDFAAAGNIKSVKVTGYKNDLAEDPDYVDSCFIRAGSIKSISLLNGSGWGTSGFIYVPDTMDNVNSYKYKNTNDGYKLNWKPGQDLPGPWVADEANAPIQVITQA